MTYLLQLLLDGGQRGGRGGLPLRLALPRLVVQQLSAPPGRIGGHKVRGTLRHCRCPVAWRSDVAGIRVGEAAVGVVVLRACALGTWRAAVVRLPPRPGLRHVHQRRHLPERVGLGLGDRLQVRDGPGGGLRGAGQGAAGPAAALDLGGGLLAREGLVQVLVVRVGLAVGEGLTVRVLQVAGSAQVVRVALVQGVQVLLGTALQLEEHSYIQGVQQTLLSKATYGSYTHSHTDGGVSHTRRQPARREQLGLGVSLRITSTLVEVTPIPGSPPRAPGIELATFRLQVNPLPLLS